MRAGLIRVRSTVTLVGLSAGEEVWADPSDPQVKRWLRGGHLIALDPGPQGEVETLTDAILDTHPEVEVVTPKPPRAKKT